MVVEMSSPAASAPPTDAVMPGGALAARSRIDWSAASSSSAIGRQGGEDQGPVTVDAAQVGAGGPATSRRRRRRRRARPGSTSPAARRRPPGRVVDVAGGAGDDHDGVRLGAVEPGVEDVGGVELSDEGSAKPSFCSTPKARVPTTAATTMNSTVSDSTRRCRRTVKRPRRVSMGSPPCDREGGSAIVRPRRSGHRPADVSWERSTGPLSRRRRGPWSGADRTTVRCPLRTAVHRVGPCRRSRRRTACRRLDDAADGTGRRRCRPAADPRRARRDAGDDDRARADRLAPVGPRRRWRAPVTVGVLVLALVPGVLIVTVGHNSGGMFPLMLALVYLVWSSPSLAPARGHRRGRAGRPVRADDRQGLGRRLGDHLLRRRCSASRGCPARCCAAKRR